MQGLGCAAGADVAQVVGSGAGAQPGNERLHKAGIHVGLCDDGATEQVLAGGAVGVVYLEQPAHLGLAAQIQADHCAGAVDDLVSAVDAGISLCLCALFEQANMVEMASGIASGGEFNADGLAHQVGVVRCVEHQHRPVAERGRRGVAEGIDRL